MRPLRTRYVCPRCWRECICEMCVVCKSPADFEYIVDLTRGSPDLEPDDAVGYAADPDDEVAA